MTNSASVVFLLVVYGNLPEVERFVEQVRWVEPSPAVSFAVCDNSQAQRGTIISERMDAVLVHRPDNPGYLQGGFAALRAAARHLGGLPDWAILSNTDLTFRSSGLLEVLTEHDPTNPVVLAPRITEGKARIEKNPHLLSRRSVARYRWNHYLTLNPLLAYGYLVASWIRLKIRVRREGRCVGPARSASGSTMYSPYGAMLIFSRAFLEEVDLPVDAPITTEEYVVAEQARRGGVPVIFEPRIHVHHDPHTTTGPRVSWRRAVRLSRAWAYIYDDARRREASS